MHHPIADNPGPVAVDGTWVDTVDGSDILILEGGQEGELEDISGVEKLHGFHLGLFASDKITDNFFLDDHAIAQDSHTRMVPGPTQHLHVELELEVVNAFFLNDHIRLGSREHSTFKLVGTEIIGYAMQSGTKGEGLSVLQPKVVCGDNSSSGEPLNLKMSPKGGCWAQATGNGVPSKM